MFAMNGAVRAANDLGSDGSPGEKSGVRSSTARYGVLTLLTGGLWAVTCVILTLQYWGEKPQHLIELQIRRAVLCLVGAGLCGLMAIVLRRANSRSIASRTLIAGSLSIVACVIYAWINHYLFYVYRPYWGRQMSIWYLLDACRVAFGTFLAWSAVYLAMSAERTAAEEHDLAIRAQALMAEAQNRMLRHQLDPHFMFNTLNALSTLILQRDSERAEQMVQGLARFLRLSLEQGGTDKVALDAERAMLREYLALEQIRFAGRLYVEERFEGGAGEGLVPSLILQPLVENAIKHGLSNTPEPVKVTISAIVRANVLMVTVDDDALTSATTLQPRLGIGLRNTRDRLAALYPGTSRFEFGPRPTGGFRVQVSLPFEAAVS